VLISIDDKTAIQAKSRIHLITDNGSSHASAATTVLARAHPRLAVTCTPEYASVGSTWWGHGWGVLTRRLLRRGGLEAQIIAFTIWHSKNARPCTWSGDAGDGHARCLARRRLPNPRPHSRKPHDRNAQ
jgi:hypothetical protein